MAKLVQHFLAPISLSDTFWSLRMGTDMWASRSLHPDRSIFATRPGIPTEWAPQILGARMEHWFGMGGINWLCAFGVVAVLVSLYTACRDEAQPLAAAVATVVAVVGAAQSLSPRPQLVTFVLLAITVRSALRMATDHRPRWWLVPLTWVWACCHGMWFLGPLVMAVGAVGLLLDRKVTLRVGGRLLLVPVGAVVAAGLTPIGPALLTTPVSVGGVTGFISEWNPPSFRTVYPALAIVAIGVVFVAWSRRGQTSWVRLGLLAMALGWTVLSARTVSIGAIIVAPLLAAEVQQRVPLRAAPTRRDLNIVRLAGVTVLAVAAVALTVHPPAPSPKLPSGLNHALDALPADTVVFTESTASSWLEWSHPDLDPVIDGWVETFSPDYLKSYLKADSAAAGWQAFLQRDHARHALVAQHSPLATALSERLHWQTVGVSAGYALLAAPSSTSE